MKKKIFLGVILFLLFGVVTACTSKKESNTSQSGNIQVVTSFYPIYEFTKHVVGDEADVEMILPAGTEAHDYEPSAKDLKKIQDADVFVYNNENMETWVPSIESVFKDGDVKVIKATENMILLPGGEEEGHTHANGETHSHELDPHVWLAPNLAIKEVEEIRDQLVSAYPDKKEVFTTNANQYIESLTQLDESYQETLSQANQKSFVTQHAAFNYLAVEYGLTQVAIAGLSPDEEPSAQRIVELKKYVSDNDIKYIYFESNASDAIAKTLAKEANVELLVLNTLEGLSNDEIEAGKDYISVMEDNLEALKKTTELKNSKAIEQPDEDTEKTVEKGYFDDKDVKDRPLKNWKGDWQSVYPLLETGDLDQVFDYKAKINKDKTVDEYKTYYETGYQTDIDHIEITDSKITFINNKGESVSSEYKYTGYKILDYEAGNRGVRYTFEAINPESGAYKYVQFSDHTITDTAVEHFHIYFGNDSQETLYKEVDNWPTYYKDSLLPNEIAQDMLSH